jgi:hypothetical protein
MAIQVRVLDIHRVSDGYEDDFLFVCGTRTRPESRRVWNGYFFTRE